MTREERVALLDREPAVTSREGLSLSAQTKMLGLNRTSLYYQRQPPSEEELLLKRRIDEIYTERPFYGYRRIAVQLQQEGIVVNRSPRYTSLLEEAGVRISMDRRGRYVDNIFTERLWRTIKYEEVYLHEYSTLKEARQSLSEYIAFYNNERPHQALGYQTPMAVYCDNRQTQTPRATRASEYTTSKEEISP